MLGNHKEEGPKSKWNVPLCCLWKERLPHRLQRVWDLVCRLLYDRVGHESWSVGRGWRDNVPERGGT